eukprot:jgi/Ulvmu1/12815/UM097_0044.1
MQRVIPDRLAPRTGLTPIRTVPGGSSFRGRYSTARWKIVVAALLLICFPVLFFTSINLRQRNLRPGTVEPGSIAMMQGNRKMLPSDLPRVALLFFGLTRSLKYTLPSIESNVVGPLQALGLQVDVYLHTYNDTDDASSRQTSSEEWRLLKPTAHVITSQELFLNTSQPLRDACWGKGTGWVKAPKVVQQRNTQNLLCQLNSLQEVGDLWLRHSAVHRLRHHAVIYLRPDVLYTDPLPVEAITNMTEEAVTIPDWAHYTGMNDRFAALGPRSAAQWKMRLAYTLSHCLDKPLHAEMFAQDFAVDHDFDVVLLQDFLFFRVRSDGSIPRGDETLPGLEQARRMIRQRKEELRVAKEVHSAHP